MIKFGRRSVILETLADRYEASEAGKTGIVTREFGIQYRALLKAAHCLSGEAYEIAQQDLVTAANQQALEIEKDRRSGNWQRILVPRTSEEQLFHALGRASPAQIRENWAKLFEEAACWTVPERFASSWRQFCEVRMQDARRGSSFEPLRRKWLLRGREQLQLTRQLLGWSHPCLIRSASAQLCHNSKRLERWRGTLECLMRAGSGGVISGFADLGIEDNPTEVRLHGPISLYSQGTWGNQTSGTRLITTPELEKAEIVRTTAPRCVTVENLTTFHELSRLDCDDLFVCTSYPNETTVRFLRELQGPVSFHHFGDSDPWGFDVLRCLREKTGRNVEPLHMQYRPHEPGVPLSRSEMRKLDQLIADDSMCDLRIELQRIAASRNKGDFEQERLPVRSREFPYL